MNIQSINPVKIRARYVPDNTLQYFGYWSFDAWCDAQGFSKEHGRSLIEKAIKDEPWKNAIAFLIKDGLGDRVNKPWYFCLPEARAKIPKEQLEQIDKIVWWKHEYYDCYSELK